MMGKMVFPDYAWLMGRPYLDLLKSLEQAQHILPVLFYHALPC